MTHLRLGELAPDFALTTVEGETITLQDIFLFKLDRVDEDGKVVGSMQPTGVRPSFLHKFQMAGIELPATLFDPGYRKGGQ